MARTTSGYATTVTKHKFLDGQDRISIPDPAPETGNRNFTKIDPGQLDWDPLMIINEKMNFGGRRGGAGGPKNRSNCKVSK